MKDDPKYQQFLIKECIYWKAYLHQDQTLLGKTYLWCKREDAQDLANITQAEQEELFKILKDLKAAISKSFSPDLFNYSSLGNLTNHLHVHIEPRYSNKREFEGQTFEDKQYGKRYIPDFDLKLSEKMYQKIKNSIQKNLH